MSNGYVIYVCVLLLYQLMLMLEQLQFNLNRYNSFVWKTILLSGESQGTSGNFMVKILNKPWLGLLYLPSFCLPGSFYFIFSEFLQSSTVECVLNRESEFSLVVGILFVSDPLQLAGHNASSILSVCEQGWKVAPPPHPPNPFLSFVSAFLHRRG